MQTFNQYCVYTRDFGNCRGLFEDFRTHDIKFEAHINRTRFWLDLDCVGHLTVYLRYLDYITQVDHEIDHTLGV